MKTLFVILCILCTVSCFAQVTKAETLQKDVSSTEELLSTIDGKPFPNHSEALLAKKDVYTMHELLGLNIAKPILFVYTEDGKTCVRICRVVKMVTSGGKDYLNIREIALKGAPLTLKKGAQIVYQSN